MKRSSVVIAALFVVVLTVAGCGHRPMSEGWVTLIDGEKGLENWNRIGDANWRAEGGVIVADKGKGGISSPRTRTRISGSMPNSGRMRPRRAVSSSA